MKATSFATVVLCSFALVALAEQPADDALEAFKPYAELVKQCERWQNRGRSADWREIHRVQFDQDPERWPKVNKWAKVVKVNGQAELHLTPPIRTTCFVPVGPKVKGEFAIEIVARAESTRPIPMCIMLGKERGAGPAFQFSILDDETHCLWSDTGPDAIAGQQYRRKDFGLNPKQIVKRNYRIRLEVRTGKVTGLIDGKPIGTLALSQKYDMNKEHQPHALTVDPTMAISSWRIEAPKPPDQQEQKMTEAQQWKKAFGDQTREQVEARITDLVLLLDDNRWKVREQASAMIRRVGDLAGPALRKAAQSDSAEMQMRAEELLEFIPPVIDSQGPAKPPAQPK